MMDDDAGRPPPLAAVEVLIAGSPGVWRLGALQPNSPRPSSVVDASA
jgi:hypothetical protein